MPPVARRVARLVVGLVFGSVFGSIFGWGAPLEGEVFRLGRWTGYVEWSYDSNEESVRGAVEETRLFVRDRSDHRFGLRNRLTVLDPGVLAVHYGLTLGVQETDVSGRAGEASGDGELLGYDVTASFFPSRRFSLDLLANRYESVSPRDFAGTISVETESYGATLRLRRIALPGTLTFRDVELETSSSSDPLLRGRDERRRTLQYRGTRSIGRQRFDVDAELAELDDRLFPRLDHQRARASVRHVYELPELRVERTGRSRRPGSRTPGTLTSRVSYSDRSGGFASSSFDWSETLQLRHRERVFSSWSFRRRDFESRAGKSESERWAAVYRHALYESLETEARFEHRSDRFGGGAERALEGRFDLRYRKRIPGGELRLAAGVGREETADRFESGESFVSRERHVARLGEPFRLDRPNVLAESVFVVDASGATIYLPGIDYTATEIGLFVEITPIPGGSIRDGDTLLVDYRFVTPSRLDFETRSAHGRLSIDLRWIEPFVSWHERDERLLSGDDLGLLDDLTDRAVGLRVRWRRPQWSFDSTGEQRTRRSRLLDYDQEQLRAELSYRPTASWRFGLQGQTIETDFATPLRETRLESQRATIEWRPRPGASIELFGSERSWTDTLSVDEVYEAVGARARLRLGRLELSGTLSEWSRVRGDDEFESLRATLRVTRRFLPGTPASNAPPRGRSGPWMGDLSPPIDD